MSTFRRVRCFYSIKIRKRTLPRAAPHCSGTVAPFALSPRLRLSLRRTVALHALRFVLRGRRTASVTYASARYTSRLSAVSASFAAMRSHIAALYRRYTARYLALYLFSIFSRIASNISSDICSNMSPPPVPKGEAPDTIHI